MTTETTTNTIPTMALHPTVGRTRGTNGKSFVMYGFPIVGEDGNGVGWFERYYPTEEAARKFAAKRGWIIADLKADFLAR